MMKIQKPHREQTLSESASAMLAPAHTNPLRVLLAIEQAGSFAQAAQQLKITQPGVSRALARLEQQYQVTLVDRSQHGARLTPIGQRLLSHARQVDAALRRAAESVRQALGEREGCVSMALSHAAIARLLPRIIPRFRRHWPQIELRISTAIYPTVLAQLRDGTIDLAVLPLPDRELPEALEVTPLGPSRLQVIARAGHPLAASRKLVDLKQAQWVLPGADSSTTRALADSFAEQGLGRPRCHTHTQTLSALQVMVACTDALGLVPSEAGASKDRIGHGLVRVPIRYLPSGPLLYRLQRLDHELTPAARALSELLARSARTQHA
jgi:LysR family transcriptional regulator of abg operon